MTDYLVMALTEKCSVPIAVMGLEKIEMGKKISGNTS